MEKSRIIEKDFITITPKGLYCPLADVYIDPWSAVEKSLNTHAHRDHISFGCGSYLCSNESLGVMKLRVGKEQNVQGINYGEKIKIGDITFSFYPAGHIIGSSQILLEYNNKRLVITGDYKLDFDKSCTAFEPIKCDILITECTFGMPIFNWPSPEDESLKVLNWWKKNQEKQTTSIIYAYPLGKSQRILAMLNKTNELIHVHQSLIPYIQEYEKLGVKFPTYESINEEKIDAVKGKGLIIAPMMFQESKLSRKLSPVSEAHASGWVQVRGLKKRRCIDQGFIISDHVDWKSLLKTIKSSEAEKIIFTHGFSEISSRYTKEVLGLDSNIIDTKFGLEDDSGGE